MSNVAIVVRELTYLKLLQPIMLEFIKRKVPYVLYHLDKPLGPKEYNRASLSKLKQSCEKIVTGAKKVRAFSDDKVLKTQIMQDKITKLVSVEIWLWAKSYIDFFKTNKIKTYSLLYLTDSIWQENASAITSIYRNYHSSKYLLDVRLKFNKLSLNTERDKVFGLPIFDDLRGISRGQDSLVLLPNIRPEYASLAFGNTNNFIKIIEKIHSLNPNLIFKTRRKQWFPVEIKKYAKEIVEDSSIMYPSELKKILSRTNMVFLFYSSGVYECAYSGNCVINIPLPLKIWPWDKTKMKWYFNDVYNFNGVVESIIQENFLNNGLKNNLQMNSNFSQWINKYMTGVCENSSEHIASDILFS